MSLVTGADGTDGSVGRCCCCMMIHTRSTGRHAGVVPANGCIAVKLVVVAAVVVVASEMTLLERQRLVPRD